MAKKRRVDTSSKSELGHNPFASLGAAMPDLPEGDAPEPEVDADPSPVQSVFGPRLIVRRERKGRGGKTATIIEGLRGDPSQLAALARDLRKALGCGTHLEGTHLVVQGADPTRTQQWLLNQGAPKVTLGN